MRLVYANWVPTFSPLSETALARVQREEQSFQLVKDTGEPPGR